MIRSFGALPKVYQMLIELYEHYERLWNIIGLHFALACYKVNVWRFSHASSSIASFHADFSRLKCVLMIAAWDHFCRLIVCCPVSRYCRKPLVRPFACYDSWLRPMAIDRLMIWSQAAKILSGYARRQTALKLVLFPGTRVPVPVRVPG